jgi:hypothetical protein
MAPTRRSTKTASQPTRVTRGASVGRAYRDLYELIADWQYRLWGPQHGPAQTAVLALSFVATMNLYAVCLLTEPVTGLDLLDSHGPALIIGLVAFATMVLLHWLYLKPGSYRRPRDDSKQIRWALLTYPAVSLIASYSIVILSRKH